jgi:hypothetical protein
MNPHVQTWWTRTNESPGGVPEAVVVRSVPALRDLAVGEATFANAPLDEMKRDDRFHPAPGTPERSYRQRIMTDEPGGGHPREFWMRMS